MSGACSSPRPASAATRAASIRARRRAAVASVSNGSRRARASSASSTSATAPYMTNRACHSAVAPRRQDPLGDRRGLGPLAERERAPLPRLDRGTTDETDRPVAPRPARAARGRGRARLGATASIAPARARRISPSGKASAPSLALEHSSRPPTTGRAGGDPPPRGRRGSRRNSGRAPSVAPSAAASSISLTASWYRPASRRATPR